MAAQRQSAARPVLSARSMPRRSPSPSDMPRQVSDIASLGVSILQPGDEVAKPELQRESERQAWFQNESNDILQIPKGYLKVAVLMIRWDDSIDEFKGHEKEMNRLQSIFTEGFGYECHITKIKNSKKPQIALDLAIMQHIMEHGGPNNLLIVYYTGHGTQVDSEDGKRLELSASPALLLQSTPQS